MSHHHGYLTFIGGNHLSTTADQRFCICARVAVRTHRRTTPACMPFPSPPQVAAAFVLQHLLSIPAQLSAFAALSGSLAGDLGTLDDARISCDLAPGLYPQRLGFLSVSAGRAGPGDARRRRADGIPELWAGDRRALPVAGQDVEPAAPRHGRGPVGDGAARGARRRRGRGRARRSSASRAASSTPCPAATSAPGAPRPRRRTEWPGSWRRAGEREDGGVMKIRPRSSGVTAAAVAGHLVLVLAAGGDGPGRRQHRRGPHRLRRPRGAVVRLGARRRLSGADADGRALARWGVVAVVVPVLITLVLWAVNRTAPDWSGRPRCSCCGCCWPRCPSCPPSSVSPWAPHPAAPPALLRALELTDRRTPVGRRRADAGWQPTG